MNLVSRHESASQCVKRLWGRKSESLWEAIWQNSTFGLPDDLADFIEQHGTEFVVGLTNVNNPEASADPTAGNREPHILQNPCAPPYLFGVKDDSVTWILFDNWNEGRAKVEAALRDRGYLR